MKKFYDLVIKLYDVLQDLYSMNRIDVYIMKANFIVCRGKLSNMVKLRSDEFGYGVIPPMPTNKHVVSTAHLLHTLQQARYLM